MSPKLTTEIFISKAKLKHNNKYIYSKTNYVNAHSPVIITCPIHGDFEQLPYKHLQNHGCPKCAEEENKQKHLSCTKEFIRKAKNKHIHEHYTYDKVNYINNETPVIITCPIHGDFKQTPHRHLRGSGCPKCGRAKAIKKQTKTTENFIQAAKIIHNKENYGYLKTHYLNNHTPVIITCPIHGDFYQTPKHHLHGCGCPKCHASRLENITEKLLQQHHVKYETQKKFNWLITEKNGKMSLDFYLPNYNIAIECQGIQHYKAAGVFTEKQVANTKERDILKRTLCERHDIKIYYIKYNENIEEKINNLLKLL